MTAGSELFVSVVLPTYQRDKELRDTITALLAQPYPKYEVVVVDQTPRHDPETERFIADLDDRVRYFRLPKPGLLGAMNFAAQQARGDLLLFLDDDIVPVPDLIAQHVRAYDSASVGAVVGRVIDERNIVVEEAPVGRVLRTGEIRNSFSATRPADAETVAGGNVSIRTDVFRQAGGFPTGYIGTAVFWEADLGCAIRRLGYRIKFVPAAEVFHLRAPSGGCANRVPTWTRDYAVYHNALLFALRYLPPHGVALALAVRTYEAFKKAWLQRRIGRGIIPIIATPHAVVTSAFLAPRQRRSQDPSRLS